MYRSLVKCLTVLSILLIQIIYFSGCGSSSETSEEEKTTETYSEKKTESESASSILNTAKSEQQNEMYSPEVDSTYQYWLDSNLIILNGSTKCNIFALNVLHEAGYKTPGVNALAADLFDTANFDETLPVISIDDISKARKGDLIIWSGHVIIFESYIKINEEEYALGWWAGTRQNDNGDNIQNNVCHGKYKLNGEFVVRRPVKK